MGKGWPQRDNRRLEGQYRRWGFFFKREEKNEWV
jgi:hypothetical protein